MPAASYQLYSSRNFGPLGATMTMLNDLGYEAVEGYGSLFEDAQSLATLEAALGESGLKMPTTHVGFDSLRDDAAGVIAKCKQLGVSAVFVPHTTEQDRTASEWAAFGAAIAEAAKPLLDAGLGIGWHNHDFEFTRFDGGDTPLDLILAGSDAMMLEFDIAWAHVAGEDPVAWMQKYQGKLLAVHVKDRAPEGEAANEDGWADVGSGVMDWAALTAAAEAAGATHFVMEHDNPSDDRRFAERSIAAFKGY